MAGMISVRLTKEERNQLKVWCKERQIGSMSELIRAQLGFTPGIEANGTGAIDNIDDIDSLDKVVKVVLQVMDGVYDLRRVVNKLARHAGVAADEKAPAPPGELPPPRHGSGPGTRGGVTGVYKEKPEHATADGFER